MAAGLATGRWTSRQLVEDALEALDDPAREGSRAFLTRSDAKARAAADGYDQMRSKGVPLAPFAGIPFGVKDLFDVQGEVTTAGSRVLADQPAAISDSIVVERLRRVGFVPIGRTHMTEFAYSGLGLNSHYDTPTSPWDRDQGRIPGGSSSGSAVAVADSLVPLALGTDTGGSCRIPAAFCGVTGYKPSARRVPRHGVFPLSPTLDSVGPLAATVDCCAIADSVMSAQWTGVDGQIGLAQPEMRPPTQVRLGLITDHMLDSLDATVARRFERAVRALKMAGVQVEEVGFPELARIGQLSANGGLAAAEAWRVHRPWLTSRPNEYDQRVLTRILPGARVTAADYMDIMDGRADLIEIAARRIGGFDGFIAPTVAITAPTIAALDGGDSDLYGPTNLLCLRNTSVANFLDGCAISIPDSRAGESGVGVMLMAGEGHDDHLLSVARTIESVLA